MGRFIGTYLYWRTNPFVFSFNVTAVLLALAGHPLHPGDVIALLPS